MIAYAAYALLQVTQQATVQLLGDPKARAPKTKGGSVGESNSFVLVRACRGLVSGLGEGGTSQRRDRRFFFGYFG